MIRYKVKPDQAEKNEQLVRSVYEELHRTQPTGLRYATFQLDDGVSFIHFHSSESDDGSNALTALPAFKRFQQDIPDRCEEGPVVTKLREIGSFRFFEGKD
jgi:quinol monooxygenase YgiN